MKLILYHFLHFYFLTLFEVIFYIYYVMPFEKKIIYDLFDSRSIKNIISDYNKTFVDVQIDKYYNNKQCLRYQNKLDKFNSKLFHSCIIYIIVINVLLMLLFIYDIYENYYNFCLLNISPKNQKYILTPTPTPTPKTNSKSSLMAFRSSQNIHNDYKKNDDTNLEIDNDFELVDINSKGKINTQTNNQTNNQINIQTNEYFIMYYFKNSKVIKEIWKLIQFIILVGIFEYLFFTYIINKYKIANSHTILCKLLEDII